MYFATFILVNRIIIAFHTIFHPRIIRFKKLQGGSNLRFLAAQTGKRKEEGFMKKRHVDWLRVSTFFICTLFLLGGLCIMANQSMAKSKSVAHKQAFALYAKKCLGCHDSVADPEKPGRTRDDWHLVVNVMHNYGMEMTPDEADMIIDLLYDLRKGMEREAG